MITEEYKISEEQNKKIELLYDLYYELIGQYRDLEERLEIGL